MKTIAAIKAIALTALFLNLSVTASAQASLVPAGAYEIRGTYVGVLTCADCPGIWTELTLVDNGPNSGSGSGSFELHERYTGGVHGGSEVITHGTWTTLKFLDFSTGTIKLVYDGDRQNRQVRYFFCDHGRSLRMLDALAHEIPAPQDQLVLQRVIPLPRRQFGPLTVDQRNTTSIGKVGDYFEIMLPATQSDWRTKWHASTSRIMVQRGQFGGSSWQPGIFTFFLLQAVAPGTDALRFTTDDGTTVTFSFEIRP